MSFAEPENSDDSDPEAGVMAFDEMLFYSKQKENLKPLPDDSEGTNAQTEKLNEASKIEAIKDPEDKNTDLKNEPVGAIPIVTVSSHIEQNDRVEQQDETETNRNDITIRPFGYLRLGATLIQDDPNVAFIGRSDGFWLQNARFGVQGGKDNIKLRLSADGARDRREDPNAISGQLQFALMDAFADLPLSSNLQIRLGYFRAQYDLETVLYPDQRMFVRRSIPSRGVRPTFGFETEGLSISRDIGVAIRAPKVTFNDVSVSGELAIQNGGETLDSSNDGEGVALTASTLVSAYGLSLRLAGRYNPRVEGELPFRQNINELSGLIGLGFVKGPIDVMGQFLYRKRTFETMGGIDELAYGGLLRAVFEIPNVPWLRGGYRYGYLHPSDRVIEDIVQEHSLAISALFPKRNVRLFVEGVHVVEESARELSNDRIEFLIEVGL